jgi:DNA-nicking Smr family endonuclease
MKPGGLVRALRRLGELLRGLLGGRARPPEPPRHTEEAAVAPADDADDLDLLADEDVVALPVGDVLDLHSFRPAEVPDLVRDWLDEVVAAGHTRVRIIHGKGRGVQRDTVRRLLARDPRVLGFGDLPAEHGGWGATWVTLRGPEP